jgi:hypothetical protein
MKKISWKGLVFAGKFAIMRAIFFETDRRLAADRDGNEPRIAPDWAIGGDAGLVRLFR